MAALEEELVVAEEFSALNVGDGYGGLLPGAVCYKAEFQPAWSEVARARNYNSMCNELPPRTKLYKVSAKNGAVMRTNMSLKTELTLQGALGPIPQGQVVHGDDEAWNDAGDLRVHIIVPNTSLGAGYVTGWVSFKTLTPLQDDGTPLPKPDFWTYELTVRLQENFEWGYKQASVQTLIRKIKSDVDDMKKASKAAEESGAKGKKVPTFREYVDALWMKVRGPALAKCGMPPSMKGLNEQQAMSAGGVPCSPRAPTRARAQAAFRVRRGRSYLRDHGRAQSDRPAHGRPGPEEDRARQGHGGQEPDALREGRREGRLQNRGWVISAATMAKGGGARYSRDLPGPLRARVSGS